MRLRLAVVAAVTALTASALLAPGTPAAAAASSCQSSQLQEVPGSAALAGSVPVVFIHGIISSPTIWDPASPDSISGQAARISGVSAWTFGYAAESLDWVTNPAIGPAFARALACLAHASGRKVVIVAHSMGGLAAQYAVAQADQYGGTVAGHVAEVVTLGTPYDGSVILTIMQALRHGADTVAHVEALTGSLPDAVAYVALAQAILSACAGAVAGICGLVNVMPHPVGTALESGSAQLKQLPPWPPALPVLDTAGDMNIQFGIDGIGLRLNLGDGAVSLGSATGYHTAGPPVIAYCTAAVQPAGFLLLVQGPEPCFHTHLPQNPLIISAVLAAIRADDVITLSQQLVPDPPLGPDFTTSGDYVQVSGAAGLGTVNAELRELIINDQAALRALEKNYPPHEGPPGIYSSEPRQGQISASSAVVSALIPAASATPDAATLIQHWVSGTYLVPSGTPVSLPSLFTSLPQGLQALARFAKAGLLATNGCVRQFNTEVGSTGDAGFAPTRSDYQYFAMMPAGLAIGFLDGQVSEMACGDAEVTVSWSQLRPYLSPFALQLISKLR
jgi:pimeloyl-ACP methyl ester carboxylesterase